MHIAYHNINDKRNSNNHNTTSNTNITDNTTNTNTTGILAPACHTHAHVLCIAHCCR